MAWRAGQFLHYLLDHPHPDDHGVERYFSIASAPREKHVMLTTRFASRSSSFKKVLRNLKPGETIDADGLEGDFVLEDATRPLVFIAGGIGITPFRAIFLDLDYKKQPLRVQLFYANHDQHFPYREELEALRTRHPEFRIDYLVSPNRLDEKSIPHLVPELDRPVFYVSGPEPMVEAMDKILQKIGVPEERVKNDFFPGYEWP